MTDYWSEYKTIRRKAFLLSVKETGASSYTLDDGVPVEGSEMPNIVSLYLNVLGNFVKENWVWSRTRLDYDKTNGYNDWDLGGGYYRNVVFMVNPYQDSTKTSIVSTPASVNAKLGCLPAFTFPNDVEVDANGRIML